MTATETIAVICAWCKRVMRGTPEPGHPVSHGICAECAAKMINEK